MSLETMKDYHQSHHKLHCRLGKLSNNYKWGQEQTGIYLVEGITHHILLTLVCFPDFLSISII